MYVVNKISDNRYFLYPYKFLVYNNQNRSIDTDLKYRYVTVMQLIEIVATIYCAITWIAINLILADI